MFDIHEKENRNKEEELEIVRKDDGFKNNYCWRLTQSVKEACLMLPCTRKFALSFSLLLVETTKNDLR